MRPERRQKILMGVLAVAVAVAAYLQWPRAAVPAGGGPPGARGAGGARVRHDRTGHPGGAPRSAVGEASAAGGARPQPVQVQAEAGAVTVARAPVPQYVPPPEPEGPPPPPPLPPIPLKFIGLLETSGTRVAVLSDGRGLPIHGKEGETVLGQYKILRINAESIEMSYLDGRGRQNIRLSGS